MIPATGAQRLAARFAQCAAEARGALIAYLCAGDPDLAQSEELMAAVAAAGADLIEVGIPYSDPLADGPTIAAASQRALSAGTTLAGVLELVRRLNERGALALAFGYFNPILQYGVERFAADLANAGAVGAIVPDLPLEESGELRAALGSRGLVLPQLVAPTTPPERAARIAAAGSGFVYLVSRLGVTGAKREPDFAWIARRVGELRASTALPLAIGFGLSSPEHVHEACRLADAAVVGSALIDACSGLPPAQARAAAGSLARALFERTTKEASRPHRM